MTKNTFIEMMQNGVFDKESLSEFILTFDDINKGIVQLYRYAGEDFTLMRNQFREYNHKAEKISDNAKRIFNLVSSDSDSSSMIKQAEDYYSQLGNYYHKFRTKTEAIEKFVDTLLGNIEKTLFPAKNLNQHINSLNIVLTNIRLQQSLKLQSSSSTNDQDSKFNKIKELYACFDKGTLSLLDSLNNAKTRIKSIKSSCFEKLDEVLDNIKTCREKSLEKHTGVSVKIPELYDNIQKNIGNSNKIIVELQYHDIIRQKIEHIQEVHDNIIQQLTRYKNDDDTTSKSDIAEYLMQVGDISRIQASQLLNANKEYELAMDAISEELLSFSENMISIVDISSRLSVNDNNEPSFCKFEEMINTNDHLRKELADENLQLDRQYSKVKDTIESVTDSFKGMAELTRQLESSFDVTLKKESITDESSENPFKQSERLFNDIRSTIAYLKALIDKISEETTGTDSNLADNFDQEEHDIILKTIKQYEQELLPEINKSKETINSVFKENNDYTKNITDRILTAIRSIKYYDCFDKLAEQIIEKLNHISDTFSISEAEANIHEMEQVKKKYTMSSERKIHNHVLNQSKNNVELFDDDDDSDNTSHVELF